MARRKGVSKSRNTGARKISINISLPLKGENRLKDDPGGTISEKMDGSKVISSEKHQSYNKPVNPRVDHQLNYGNSPVIEFSNNRQQNSNTTKTPSVSTSDQNEPVLITTQDETSETRTSTEHTNNNNNNNNISHHSNSSINSSTTTTTVTSSTDLKYLHKKFKRIASATSEIFDAVDKIHHHHHTHHHTNKKLNNVIGNRKDGGESRSPSESLEIISKSTTNNFKEQQRFRNSCYSIGNHEDSSHVIYNGTGRLSPLFQTIEASPKTNTGYCSDGEMKSSISNNYSVTSSQSANHQIIKPLSLQKSDDPLVSNSLYKSNEISPQQYPVNHGTIANHNSYNNVLGHGSISPISTASRNISIATTSSSNPIVAAVGNNVQYSKSSVSQSSTSASQLQRPQSREVDQNITGRYTCPFCNLNCTKPSVLQKHIRAHTNERPYPCDTCCFAFKTKSNYYKHCRSRTHALRAKGIDPQPDDENSIGSDPDPDPDFSNSSSDVISRTASPLDERTSSPAIQFPAAAVIQQYHKYSNDKPYKPKFHNAALYVKEEYSPQRHQSQIQQPPLSHQPQQQQLQQSQQQLQPIQIPNIHYTTNHHQQHLPQNYLPSSHIQQQDQDSSSLYQQQHQQPAKNRLEYALQHTPQLLQQVSLQTPAFSDTSRDATSTSAISGRSISSASNVGHQLNVEEHISNLISRNEAIVENKELLLQKKYPKVSGKTKNSTLILPTSSNSRLAYVLNNKQQLQQQQHSQQQSYQPQMITISTNGILPSVSLQLSKMGAHTQSVQQPHQLPSEPTSTQPLNLSKLGEQLDNTMKRMSTESTAIQLTSSENVPASSGKNLATHPQNPERSIIKHLLLNARGQAISNGDGEDAIYTCALCKLEFHSVDDLKLHSSQYCQGGPSSAPISPVGSPSFKFSRSNSINVNLTEFNNPNSLAKLARNPRSLAKLAWYQLKTKPSNLVLTQLSVNTNSTTSQASQPSTSGSSTQRLIDAPLPSPGPLLGKTPLVEAYNNSDRKSDDVIITRVHEEGRNFAKGFSPKRLRFDNYMQSAISSPRPPNSSSDIPGSSSLNKSYMMCGGDITPLEKKDEPMRRFLSSGGCMIPLSDCPDVENSPKIIRTPLLSGGSFTEISPKSQQTPKIVISIPSLTPSLSGSNLLNSNLTLPTQFQFPPINSITAYNPLTLPPVTMGSVLPTSVSHGDKIIPFVPGIPGPNSLLSPHLSLPPQKTIDSMLSRNISPNRKKTPSPLVQSSLISSGLHHSLQKHMIRIDDDSANSNEFFVPQRVSRSWIPLSEPVKKSFNFTRIADNLSPCKPIVERPTISPERGTEPPKQSTFDKTSTKVETSSEQQSSSNQLVPLHVDITPSSKEKDQQEVTETVEQKAKVKSKFLRPTSLPLKPGTFTPKCHHGITPNANTLPLISPETPRPSKACVQLYLNGHAYTYLGLKSSTKMFYCTVNGAQPSYIPNLHRLSMYSVWQVCAENNPHPLGLKPKAVMSLYDSRQRNLSYSMASIRSVTTIVHSQATVMTPFENNAGQFYHHQIKSLPEQSVKSDGSQKSGGSSSSRLVGGYESNEDYTYVRGRGRGRYVCSECGIRCKKPSMLKKHIRTHTDVRPYTCQHCSFSFKTKGNLTKHMQSKTHYKKCLELGINPGPLPMDELMDIDGDLDQQSINSGGGRTSSVPGESDSDDYSDGNDGETESSDTDESKSRMPEHEAARCLLSLSMTPPSNNVSPNAFAHRSHYSYSQSSFSDAFQNSGRRQSDDSLFASRRVISFTSPKPPFDYQKQEQYFSNPSLHMKTARVDKFEETAMKPIDLTKPRHMEQQQYRIPDAVCEVSTESGFLKSLVSITDKIRPTTEHSFGQSMTKFNEDVLLQAYLTEQALKYTKIKQSQMSKTYTVSSTSSAVSTVPICSIKTADVIRPVSSPGLCASVISIVTTTAAPFTIPRILIQSDTATADEEEDLPPAILSDAKTVLDHRIEHSDNDNVSVTNSETRSKSPQRITPAVVKQNAIEESSKDTTLNAASVKSSVVSSTGSAKSVASEYLKMTSAECLKSRNTRMEESEDSCSDQETNAVETGLKPSADFSGIVPPTVIVGEDGFKSNSNEAQLIFPRVHLSDDGRPVCKICFKTFQKQHQMVLHMNIHYMERKFKCEPCAVSFRTQGHLQKHERSEAHKNKVMMNSTFGVPTTSNPRPFECSDCKVAFRIHGHLAKHLRSKTHVQKLECLQKLPFGTYAEIERAGISLTEIDTTDCDNSLASLRVLAQRLIEKDPNKMGTYTTPSCIDGNSHESGSEDSPDAPNDGPESSMGMGASGGSSSTDSLVGVKRKFDSFSSCSNDSTSNTNQQELGLEKRVRTTSSEI